MSAYMVSKVQIDLLVRAAIKLGSPSEPFRWWKVNEAGEYAGWHEIDEYSEGNEQEGAHITKLSPSQVGQILVSENFKSVSYRYDSEDDLPGPNDAYYVGPYVYEDPLYTFTAGQAFAAIDNLDYQSCEHDEWPRSEAYALLRSIRHEYCRKLQGDSPWGFDEEWLAEQPKDTSISLMSMIKKPR